MKMRKISLIFSLLIISSMVLAACAPAVVADGGEDTGSADTGAADDASDDTGGDDAETMSGPEMKNPDTYIALTIGDPETLDPAWTYETAGSAIENNVYEGMIWFNREDTGSFVPVLATSWDTNAAGDVITFNIREGVSFHEGGTLEPHDVAYSIQRALLQDRTGGPHWMTLEAFFGVYGMGELVGDGAGAVADGSAADLLAACEAVKEVAVADDAAGTVTFTLAQPTPWFFAMMANSFMGAVLDMEWMIDQGAWDGDCATWQNYNDPAPEDTVIFNVSNGTGPYKLDSWIPNEEIVLVANQDYWRAEGDPIWEGGPSGIASIDRVVIRIVDEWGTRLASFEAGDADYIYVPSQFRPQVEESYGQTYTDTGEKGEDFGGWVQAWVNLPSLAMTPAQFNHQLNTEGGNIFMGSGVLDGNGIPADFFQDIHVRKAFNWCMDFDTMINDALNGEGIQSQGPIIAGMLGYREGEAPLYSYDLAKCEEEFKAADSDVWETGFYFQMAYNIGNDTRRLSAEILKAGIESINDKFTIEVVGMPWPVLLASRRAGKLPIYVGGWLEDFHDPHNWVHPFLHSTGAYGAVANFTDDLAAEFDALIEEAASLATADERRPIYEEIQLKAQEDAVMIWLYQGVGRLHYQEWINGVYYNPAYSAGAYSYVYALSKGE